MPTPRNRSYSPGARISAQILGNYLQVARRQRRMSSRELGERLGASRGTVMRMESGDLRVCLGLYFEACLILQVPLWGGDMRARGVLHRHLQERLALLPQPPRISDGTEG